MRTSYNLIFLFTLSVFCITALDVSAKEKRYSVKLYSMDNKVTRGTLDSVTEKGLYILQKNNRTATFVDVTQIKEIKLRRKGKSGTGSAIGFISGLVVGATGVVLLKDDDNLANTLHIVGAGLFTFITTAIGGGIGSKYDNHFYINGRSEDYLQNLQSLKTFIPSMSK